MGKDTIVYIGNFDLPEASAAGKRVYGASLIFRDLGYRVLLLGKPKKTDLKRVICSDDIEYLAMPNFGLIKPHKYIEWLKTFLIQENCTPELIVRYGSPAIAWFDYLLYRFANKQGIPIVNDVVDWLSAGDDSILFNIVKTVDTWFEKAVFNKLGDGVIAISSYLENYYKKCCPNTIILPPLVEKYEEPTEANNITTIVYAGTPFRTGKRIRHLEKVKDRLDIAVKTLTELSSEVQFQFDIYGLTKDEYLCAYPEQAELLSKADTISFRGKQSMKIVQEAVHQADYTILLRDKNRETMAGFPTKVVESIACGTPVITTDTSDLKKYIIEETNGFFVDIKNEEYMFSKFKTIIKKSKIERTHIKKLSVEQDSFLSSNFLNDTRLFIDKVSGRRNNTLEA